MGASCRWVVGVVRGWWGWQGGVGCMGGGGVGGQHGDGPTVCPCTCGACRGALCVPELGCTHCQVPITHQEPANKQTNTSLPFCLLQGTGKLEQVEVADWTAPTIDSWRHSIWVGVWDPWIVVFKVGGQKLVGWGWGGQGWAGLGAGGGGGGQGGGQPALAPAAARQWCRLRVPGPAMDTLPRICLSSCPHVYTPDPHASKQPLNLRPACLCLPAWLQGPRMWYKVMREIVTLERMHRAFDDGLMEVGGWVGGPAPLPAVPVALATDFCWVLLPAPLPGPANRACSPASIPPVAVWHGQGSQEGGLKTLQHFCCCSSTGAAPLRPPSFP